MGSYRSRQLPGSWSSLLELGVGDCLLSARGGVKVAEALAANKNPKLQTLRLQYNEIKAEAVKALHSRCQDRPSQPAPCRTQRQHLLR